MLTYEIEFRLEGLCTKILRDIYEVQINNGAYHFYNVEDILCCSIPVDAVHSVELI